MRLFRLLPLALLLACKGTVLTEIQSAYVMSPTKDGPEHGGSISGHVGGSELEFFGIGLSARARIVQNGCAIPEIGPQVFLFHEDDQMWGFYGRLSLMAGLAGFEGTLTPVFTARLNPGFVFYPADDPLFLSIGLSGEIGLAPVGNHHRGWLGIQIGFGFGGVGHG